MPKSSLNWPGKRPALFDLGNDAPVHEKLDRTTCHGPQDFQSLAMHKTAVRMVQSDPRLIEKALAILARWEVISDPRSKLLRDEWVRILNTRDWALALENSDRGNQLRQASPMAALLPQKVRLGIIRDVRKQVAKLNA